MRLKKELAATSALAQNLAGLKVGGPTIVLIRPTKTADGTNALTESVNQFSGLAKEISPHKSLSDQANALNATPSTKLGPQFVIKEDKLSVFKKFMGGLVKKEGKNATRKLSELIWAQDAQVTDFALTPQKAVGKLLTAIKSDLDKNKQSKFMFTHGAVLSFVLAVATRQAPSPIDPADPVKIELAGSNLKITHAKTSVELDPSTL